MTAAFLKVPSQNQAITARAKVESDFSAVKAAERVTKLYERLLLDPFDMSTKAI
jgi:hypothetical protein